MDSIDDIRECIKQLQRELVQMEYQRPIMVYYPTMIRCLQLLERVMKKYKVKDLTVGYDSFGL
jgi:hypothetical protein